MKSYLLFAAFFLGIVCPATGQVYSNKIAGKKNETELDSIKAKPYPYILPIWGEKVTKWGLIFPILQGWASIIYGLNRI